RFSPTDVVHCIDDSSGRGGACRHGGVIWPHETKFYRDPPRRYVHNDFRNEERIYPRRTVTPRIVRDLLLKGVKASVSASPDDTNACFVYGIQVDRTVAYRFGSRYQRVLGERVHLPDLRFFKMIQR